MKKHLVPGLLLLAVTAAGQSAKGPAPLKFEKRQVAAESYE